MIKSDSEDSDPGWLSKEKVINGTSTKSGIAVSKLPSTGYKVKRRAVLSSSEDDDNNVTMLSQFSDQSDSVYFLFFWEEKYLKQFSNYKVNFKF